MPIPKTVLQELLRAVPSDRLRVLAKHFTRMQGVNPPEFYVERMATTERVSFVISDLNLEELKPLASRLGLSPIGLATYTLKKRLISRIELYSEIEAARSSSPPRAHQTYALIGEKAAYETIWKHLQIRREVPGDGNWTNGEQLARLTLATAVSASVRMAVACNVFLELIEDWPEPVVGSLREIGANLSADLLLATYSKQFSTIPTGAGVDERSSILRQYVPDFPNEAKEWKRDWSATRESVETLARNYLMARPELFQD